MKTLKKILAIVLPIAYWIGLKFLWEACPANVEKLPFPIFLWWTSTVVITLVGIVGMIRLSVYLWEE